MANPDERVQRNPIMPVDKPLSIRAGVMMREADWQGSAKHTQDAQPPESAERAEKGDLGLSFIKGMEPKEKAPFIIKGAK